MDLRRIARLLNEKPAEKWPTTMVLQPIVFKSDKLLAINKAVHIIKVDDVDGMISC